MFFHHAKSNPFLIALNNLTLNYLVVNIFKDPHNFYCRVIMKRNKKQPFLEDGYE